MFKSISWQEYLLAVGCLAAVYYVVAVAIFYFRDILLKFKGAASSKAQPEISKTAKPQGKFMGSISTSIRKKIPTKQSIASSEDLSFESQPEYSGNHLTHLRKGFRELPDPGILEMT